MTLQSNITCTITEAAARVCPRPLTRTAAAALALCLLLITSCSTESIESTDNTGEADNTPVPVLFDTYTTTRANTGLMTQEALQRNGFGVFAYYTEGAKWTGKTDSHTPNFMYNQPVKYQSNAWQYEPIKYWPNDNAIADDGDAPGEDHAATGSRDHSYVSFFAYAPYVDVDVATGAISDNQANTSTSGSGFSPATGFSHAPDEYGIIALTANSTAGAPKITYRAPAGPDLTNAVDLLWGVATRTVYSSIGTQSNTTSGLPLRNLTKPAANEMVRFSFNHALAQLRLSVQAAFDELSPGTNDVDGNTRILVNSITVGAGPEKAVLNLDNTTANTPLWENVTTETPSIHNIQLTNTTVTTEGGTDCLMNGDIRNTYTIDAAKTVSEQYSDLNAEAFDALPAGVTVTKKPVLNLSGGSDSNWAYLFIPMNYKDGTALNTLDVTISYDVITHDESLVRNNPKGFSIIRNTISQTLTLGEGNNFKPGRQYRLNIILGMATVKLGIEEMAGWETTDVNIPQTTTE